MKNSPSLSSETAANKFAAFPFILGALAGLVAAGTLNPYFKDFSLPVQMVIAAVLLFASSLAFGFTWPRSTHDTPVENFSVTGIVPTKTEKQKSTSDEKSAPNEARAKILDTSIIIDGRIIDIAATGFLEPPFLVPNFVLREIQLISDSPDAIKRNRGRRGLDMLNQLQKRSDLEVKISYKDYTETREVDQKLIRLAKDTGGFLVTNDFNLNKVAELQGVRVLNMNNLANALKPVVLPGEELELQVIKEGKDENQGIAYLEDGTMVVIEGGGKLIGKKVKINVSSVIQTNAGKMVFTKLAQK